MYSREQLLNVALATFRDSGKVIMVFQLFGTEDIKELTLKIFLSIVIFHKGMGAGFLLRKSEILDF